MENQPADQPQGAQPQAERSEPVDSNGLDARCDATMAAAALLSRNEALFKAEGRLAVVNAARLKAKPSLSELKRGTWWPEFQMLQLDNASKRSAMGGVSATG